MNQVINFEDKKINLVKLNTHQNYLIDGEIVRTSYNNDTIEVKNIDDIRLVNETNIIKYYTDGTNTMSKEEYIKRKKELTKGIEGVDDYDRYKWNSLEDEFNYRKFIEVWAEVEETVQTISDPIKVEIIKTKYDTGNKFIKNAFLYGDNKPTLFKYDRPEAVKDIVKNCFKELGMEFEEDVCYSNTKGKKVWGNAQHSCIRYVTAFGGYIFNERWDIRSVLRGTLEECEGYYNKDKEELEDLIKAKYREHFGIIDQDKFDFKKLLSDLRTIENRINSLDVKKNSDSKYLYLVRDIYNVIKMVEDSFEVK